MGQESAGQASTSQVSETSNVELTSNLRTVMLPKGSLHVETTEDHARLLHMTNMSINFTSLSIQILHDLNQVTSEDLHIPEKRALLIINKLKTNNQ